MIDPVAFHSGSIDIRWYGIILSLSLLTGIVLACFRAKNFGIETDHVLDALFFIIPFAILGARAYNVIFSW